MLSLWRNLQLAENALSEHDMYKVYSNIVTGGITYAVYPSDTVGYANQAILDIDQLRILSLSDRFDPSAVHVGLLIYSVDGQTDFVINNSMLRIKSGDILIRTIHHSFTGQIDVYHDLIRSLFGTHRINLVGLVFTFSASGQFSDCMRLGPSASHTSPMHPIEQKMIEIALVTLYMNDAWMTMPVISQFDVESLSQSAKKQLLFKLAGIEQLYNKIREKQSLQTQTSSRYLPHFLHRTNDNFTAFQWTPNRKEIFDASVQRLLDEFYNRIEQILPTGEFDRDQYAYYNDNTKQVFSTLV